MLDRFLKKKQPLDDYDDEHEGEARAKRRTIRIGVFKFGVPGFLGLSILLILLLSYIWDADTPFLHPKEFDVRQVATERLGGEAKIFVTGYVTTSTLIELISYLLDKPGGFLSNDVTPPGVLMDNTHSWEFGVVVQVRDFARVMRNDISRAQSQSAEDPDLAIAEPDLNNDITRWIFPSIESQFRDAIDHLTRYLNGIRDAGQQNAHFYARADNLREWLLVVKSRLGSLSQRLSASVGQARVDIDRGGELSATQGTPHAEALAIKTPWMEIDDVFYEVRGSTFALVHLLRAVQVDFAPILNNKNAMVSLRQVIRELESTHETMWSPVILNGTGFGPFANHSLVMASYIARANAAVGDLVNLLYQG
jgi:hypothetical protein